MEIDSSIQSFSWNSSPITSCDYFEAAVNISENIASPITDFKDSHRAPYSSNINFPGASAISQGRTEDENLIPLVGLVHHHYPNHSSVKAIHPNSQIFRSCYPDTPYSTGGGHDVSSGRHESELGWSSTPHDTAVMDESPRGYPFPSTTPFHPQSGYQQSKHVHINQNRCCANCSAANSSILNKMESRDSTNDHGVTSTLRIVLKPQDGSSWEECGGTKRDCSTASSFNSPKTHPHSEFFRFPNLYQRCCAYHPQNKENQRKSGFSLHSNTTVIERDAESVFKYPEKKHGMGENSEEKMPLEKGEEQKRLDGKDMKEDRKKENIQVWLLQEQVRVLLWALLGSERLSSAARATCADDSTHICWSEMPVRDLLGALLGSCGCSDCRPRRSFYELAYTLLNMCPPLSDRLAGGGPDVLTRVVASVYHNDLMPSIRKHEAHFPEGVHNSMDQVARLEMKLEENSHEKHPSSIINSKSESSRLVELEIMADRENTPKLKEESEFMKMEAEKQCKETFHVKDPHNVESDHEFIKRPKHWLHPHQQLLVDGLVNNPHIHFIKRSSSDDKYIHKEESDPPEHTQIQTSKPGEAINGHVPIIKRKRGRPPKNEGKSINANPRKKRTLLWKFLITLLDETEENSNQKISSYLQKTQNLSDLRQKEHVKSLEDQQNEKEINTADRANKTYTVYNSPMCLRWISREDGIFRILDTTDLARKWGYQHKNPNMTYEKMSRAMRTYYQRKVLVPVPRSYNLPKKLVYKFNPLLLKQMPSNVMKNK